MNALIQVAKHLNISLNQIKGCEEWARVWFVVIHGMGGRFVSKKVITAMNAQQEGWKLHIPASPTGKRRTFDFCYVGTKEKAMAVLDKSLHELAAKQGIWTPMSQEEIEVELAKIDEDLDRF